MSAYSAVDIKRELQCRRQAVWRGFVLAAYGVMSAEDLEKGTQVEPISSSTEADVFDMHEALPMEVKAVVHALLLERTGQF